MTRASSLRAALCGATLGLGLCGCSVTVVTNLDEARANQVVSALDARGIGSEKAPDEANADHFQIDVAHDDAARAVTALTEDELPARPPATLLDALAAGALVPSRETEHARWLAGTAGELERSLEVVDGVLSAHVHLVELESDPLEPDAPLPRPTASVLLRYRGAKTPIAVADVRRLVAGAVPDLNQEDVAVVTVAAVASTPRDVVHLGPLSTTSATAKKVRFVLGAIAVLNLLLAASLLALWTRLRRLRPVVRRANAARGSE